MRGATRHLSGHLLRRHVARPRRLPAARRGAGRPRPRGATRWRTPSSPATRRPPRCSRCARTASSWRKVQGVEPEWMHVALGGSKHETDRFRVADHMAYYPVRARFEESWRRTAAVPRDRHLPGARRTLRGLSMGRDVRRPAPSRRSPVARRGHQRRQRTELRGARRHHPGRARRRCRCPSDHRSRGSGADARPRAGAHPGGGRGASTGCCSSSLDAAGGGHGSRAAAAAIQGDLFFDLEGDPFVQEGGGRPRLPVRSGSRPFASTGKPAFHAIWGTRLGG